MSEIMKDYYRILGLKEGASDEEIRTRWIELTKHYHPDLTEGSETDEKMKEINEAYQILKFSSSRMEYDLKRKYYLKKRRAKVYRKAVPTSLAILFIIIVSVFFIKTNFASLSSLNTLSIIIPQKQTSIKSNPIDPKDQIDPKTQRTQRPNGAIDSTTQRPIDAITQSSLALKIDEKDQKNQTDQINQTDQKNPINASTQGPIDPITQSPLALKIDQKDPTDQKNPIDQENPIDAKTQLRQSTLIATEKEVRQFLATYAERYTKKDLDGFLSLFSSEAVQNQKERLEDIRKTYTHFFKQSQEIQYYIEDIKIEIYQNGVEVKARYELVQILRKGEEKKTWRGRIRWTLVKEQGALKILSLDYQHQKSY